MDGEREGLKPKPGKKVVVIVDGRRTEGQLLNPVRAGYPDGAWWVLFSDGMAGAFTPEGMEVTE